MAVPKKRTSKAKRNTRRTLWKRKASQQTKRSFSLAASILRKRLNQKQRLQQQDNEL
jgi:large subunit ribosomal protein L32